MTVTPEEGANPNEGIIAVLVGKDVPELERVMER